MDAVERLERGAPKRVSAWAHQVITERDAAGWLLDHAAFALLDSPESSRAVAAVLDGAPPAVRGRMVGVLAACRRADGGWHWPPSGVGLSDPVGWGPWAIAEQREADVLDALGELLRPGGAAAQDAEQGAAPDPAGR